MIFHNFSIPFLQRVYHRRLFKVLRKKNEIHCMWPGPLAGGLGLWPSPPANRPRARSRPGGLSSRPGTGNPDVDYPCQSCTAALGPPVASNQAQPLLIWWRRDLVTISTRVGPGSRLDRRRRAQAAGDTCMMMRSRWRQSRPFTVCSRLANSARNRVKSISGNLHDCNLHREEIYTARCTITTRWFL